MGLISDVVRLILLLITIFVFDTGSTTFPVNFNAFLDRFVRKENSRQDLKNYSGKRTFNESARMTYVHDQTVAVVELGINKLLLNCEFIEIYQPNEVSKVLGESLKNTNVVMISLEEMLKLMSQCWELENHYLNTSTVIESDKAPQSYNKGLLPISSPFALFSGIIPGTKWCGTGDIARSYFDLGAEISTDRCCRAHDLCPIKIRAYSQRYNLTNDSLYTKSHCACDEVLYSCLKQADSPSANLLGNIYFNLVQVPCLGDTDMGRQFRKVRRNF